MTSESGRIDAGSASRLVQKTGVEHLSASDLRQAVAGMASDLKTHPDTDNPALTGLAMIGMMYVTDGDKAAVQHWIERFR